MNCLADLSLREFTPDLTKDVRNPYCLVYFEAADTHPGFSEVDCNAYLICNNPQTVSESVIIAKDEALTAARSELPPECWSALQSQFRARDHERLRWLYFRRIGCLEWHRYPPRCSCRRCRDAGRWDEHPISANSRSIGTLGRLKMAVSPTSQFFEPKDAQR